MVVLRRGGIHPDRSRKAGSWHRDHPGAERGHRNRQIQRISDEYTISGLVKKYSDYIRYPITMYREKSRQKPKPEDAGDDYKPEYETYTELET